MIHRYQFRLYPFLKSYWSFSIQNIYSVLELYWRSTMTHFTKIATGLTGLAALAAVSSPAGAQMNPYGHGNNGGVVGAIVNAVTGYGQYPEGNYGYEQMGQRSSVEMCARSAEQRLNGDRRYAGYNNRYGQTGYAEN